MHKPAWMVTTAVAIIMSLGGAAHSNAAGSQPNGAQAKLDLIAAIPQAQASKDGGFSLPTGPYASWTPDQQRSAPEDLQKFCAGFWTFINGADGPPTARLLPASVPGADEIRLVLDVCLVAHLPADWPERGARLRSATSILTQADQAGASLHLPTPLSR